VLGLTKKEIDEKIDEIIDFAEIRDAIDMPVQNYSSGMSVRLGFAVATTLEPDILILDEVLAVGDASFRAKCYKRIGELQDRAAVIFVSHSMEQMSRLASIALVLDYGKVNFLGDLAKGIELYEAKSAYFDDQQAGFLKYTEEISNGELTLVQSDINWGDSLTFNIIIISNVAIQDLTITGVIYDSTNQVSLSFVNPDDKTLEIRKGFNKLSVTAADITLANGIYKIGLVLNKKSNIKHIFWSYKQIKFTIKNAPRGLSINRKTCEVDFLTK
jgi:lipopolysaccharide transport system ATP-binding protein